MSKFHRFLGRYMRKTASKLSNKPATKLPTPRDARVAAVRATAEKQQQRLNARNTPDDKLFKELSWVREAAISQLSKNILASAGKGDTKICVSLHCSEDGSLPLSVISAAYDVRISPWITDSEFNSYSFHDMHQMWQFFYQFCTWLPQHLEEVGYAVEMATRVLPSGDIAMDGWNDKNDCLRFNVIWENDDLRDNLKYVYDPAQAKAYEHGIKLQDLFLGDPEGMDDSDGELTDFEF